MNCWWNKCWYHPPLLVAALVSQGQRKAQVHHAASQAALSEQHQTRSPAENGPGMTVRSLVTRQYGPC